MPLSKSLIRRINDCLDMMSRRLDEIETAHAKDYAEDDLEEINEEQFINPLDAPPNAPFADSPPSHIHGEPKEDEFWPAKPRVPVPIETL